MAFNNVRKNINLVSSEKEWRYYEDVIVGEKRKSENYFVTEKEIVDFASNYDPQWFHTNIDEAKNSKFQSIIASGIHVAALWRQLDHKINGDINFVCGIGWDLSLIHI